MENEKEVRLEDLIDVIETEVSLCCNCNCEKMSPGITGVHG
jgi:hypothetical protein